MLNPHLSYQENFERGPSAQWTAGGVLPKIKFLGEEKFSCLGQPVHLPFGIPAGPLLNARYLNAAWDAGFCVPVYKTVRSRVWPSHPVPNMVKIEGEKISGDERHVLVGSPISSPQEIKKQITITNSFGVPSQDPKYWKNELKLCLQNIPRGKMLGWSFQGTRLPEQSMSAFCDDVRRTSDLILDVVTDVGSQPSFFVEMNLSCPNEDGKPVYKDYESVRMACAALPKMFKEKNVPVLLKVGAVESFDEAARFFEMTLPFIHGVCAVNSLPHKIVGKRGEAILGPGRESAGVCGAALLNLSLRTVECLAETALKLGLTRKECEIFGVGGVSTVEDFIRMQNAGAHIVQSATGAMWNPDLASQIALARGVEYTWEKI